MIEWIETAFFGNFTVPEWFLFLLFLFFFWVIF